MSLVDLEYWRSQIPNRPTPPPGTVTLSDGRTYRMDYTDVGHCEIWLYLSVPATKRRTAGWSPVMADYPLPSTPEDGAKIAAYLLRIDSDRTGAPS